MILWGADVYEVTYIRLTLDAKLGNDPLGKNFNDSQPNDFSNFPAFVIFLKTHEVVPATLVILVPSLNKLQLYLEALRSLCS